jgi:hypothetical protein
MRRFQAGSRTCSRRSTKIIGSTSGPSRMISPDECLTFAAGVLVELTTELELQFQRNILRPHA